MTDSQHPPSSDVSRFVSDYFWRFDLERTSAEHVRRSDGFVVNRRRMTPEEITREMRKSVEKQGAKESDMENAAESASSKSESRNRGLVGQKWNKLTLKKLVGQNETNYAWYGEFECDCGNIVERAMVSDVRTGRRPDCGAKCELRDVKAKPRKAKKARRTTKSKPEAQHPGESVFVKSPPPPVTQISRETEYHAKLIELAARLRRWAVESRRQGWSTHHVDPMRREAELIDELVYLEA